MTENATTTPALEAAIEATAVKEGEAQLFQDLSDIKEMEKEMFKDMEDPRTKIVSEFSEKIRQLEELASQESSKPGGGRKKKAAAAMELASRYRALIAQYAESDTLLPLAGLPRHYGAYSMPSEEEYSSVLAHVRSKLKSSKEYTFHEPDYVEQLVADALEEPFKSHVRIFSYRFLSYVAQTRLKDNAIFVSNVIINANRLRAATRPYPGRDSFLSAVRRIIAVSKDFNPGTAGKEASDAPVQVPQA